MILLDKAKALIQIPVIGLQQYKRCLLLNHMQCIPHQHAHIAAALIFRIGGDPYNKWYTDILSIQNDCHGTKLQHTNQLLLTYQQQTILLMIEALKIKLRAFSRFLLKLLFP